MGWFHGLASIMRLRAAESGQQVGRKYDGVGPLASTETDFFDHGVDSAARRMSNTV